MGKPTGFLEFQREAAAKRNVDERRLDYNEVELPVDENNTQKQAARCMDCGVPFCHNGCPLGNIIPEFNDAVYEENWEYAYQILSSTNNFPEFTGRICPAPCESSCVLGINKPPVAIEYIEKSIIEKAYANGWVKPNVPKKRTGKKVAVVGSGPAGLAAASQLNKAGHLVTVFERADEVGGLLRYGIPDFKLDKSVVRRRVEVMKAEGIEFITNANVGVNVKASDLVRDFDAIVLAGGSTVPRMIEIKGKELKGIYPAMEFLSQQNKRVSGIERVNDHRGSAYQNGELLATGKNVVVIGGGDTGSDCVGTSNRHKAKSITQVEVMPEPELDDKKQPFYQVRSEATPWPMWPLTKRTSTSHEEGCERLFSINVKEFIGDENGNLKGILISESAMFNGTKVEMNEREIPCELALIAAGFLHPQQDILSQLEIEVDERKNAKAPNYQTSNPKIFAAGDMRRGQSLVVWAISEGRECARKVDEYLMGETLLEAKAVSMISPAYAEA
ncbi:glutamate synthase, NADH/NADPH, small subunit [Emticicia oligotrophica DSM 17448]|uniref:Glutamate synthase, NADH/NADPH, small subunit n=1 Tax=Emticicia oligotrophica (strain DSM 17448 / CIP 109782 / MTCC 6937 / GPTSA100-15) TaxID=929562 RepID=A0ABN4AT82_EMTOG|nr:MULTISPECIES: glutamate synthase subunit beta [Emticicia]AFK05061.1 glutamate synthase, NADH/NADPH, small subunit [Emticicia oligotrophica DSM 17448]